MGKWIKSFFSWLDTTVAKLEKQLERGAIWHNGKLKMLSASDVNRKRVAMIFYLIPNLIIAIIAILSFGFQLGWDKMITFPYELMWLYLIWFGIFLLWIKWNEPKEEEEERQKLIKDISDEVSQSIIKTQAQLIENIQKLVNEIRQGRG